MRALLTGCLLALALTVPAAASEQHPTPAELESELICPVCETTLDTSSARIALRMKARIRQRIAAGATKSEIKAEFVEDFGNRVLAVPPKRGFDLLAWLLPLVGLAVATAIVGLLSWRWSRRGRPVEPVRPLDPDLERRLDAELARFE